MLPVPIICWLGYIISTAVILANFPRFSRNQYTKQSWAIALRAALLLDDFTVKKTKLGSLLRRLFREVCKRVICAVQSP